MWRADQESRISHAIDLHAAVRKDGPGRCPDCPGLLLDLGASASPSGQAWALLGKCPKCLK